MTSHRKGKAAPKKKLKPLLDREPKPKPPGNVRVLEPAGYSIPTVAGHGAISIDDVDPD